MEAGQIQLQIDTPRRQCQRPLDDVDCFGEMPIPGELPGKLLKGRQEWRPPGRGPAQKLDSLGAASGGAQRGTQESFDGWSIVAARRLFQRRNRLVRSFLSEEGPGQDRHSRDIGPARSQHFRGKLLRLDERLHPQRKRGAFEQLGV
jgi:hypothetical protein